MARPLARFLQPQRQRQRFFFFLSQTCFVQLLSKPKLRGSAAFRVIKKCGQRCTSSYTSCFPWPYLYYWPNGHSLHFTALSDERAGWEVTAFAVVHFCWCWSFRRSIRDFNSSLSPFQFSCRLICVSNGEKECKKNAYFKLINANENVLNLQVWSCSHGQHSSWFSATLSCCLSTCNFFLLQVSKLSNNSAKLSAHHKSQNGVSLSLSFSQSSLHLLCLYFCHTLTMISASAENSFGQRTNKAPAKLVCSPQTVAQTSTMQFQSILWHIYLPSTWTHTYLSPPHPFHTILYPYWKSAACKWLPSAFSPHRKFHNKLWQSYLISFVFGWNKRSFA